MSFVVYDAGSGVSVHFVIKGVLAENPKGTQIIPNNPSSFLVEILSRSFPKFEVPSVDFIDVIKNGKFTLIHYISVVRHLTPIEDREALELEIENFMEEIGIEEMLRKEAAKARGVRVE
jgi:hypothetical protein